MASTKRNIRVFVSSTFRDMQAEREELVKRVFPRLRKLCDRRGVIWGEVDLRWGVTDEQKAEGGVLPICLAEIQRCRPYFIGLLGERYGWIPDEVPQELIRMEPWLKGLEGRSVTELEILHGVLNNPEMAQHAFFFFRDPSYLSRLPPGTDLSDFRSEDERAREKLRNLKEVIRKSGFPLFDNYLDPETLGKLVFETLQEVICRLYLKDQKLDPLEREAAEHESFALSRARVYVGREEYFYRLDKHVEGEGLPLVVLGDSGTGKSTLLANWAFHHQTTHPEDLLIVHFIGASPSSADWASMLRRVMGELKRRFQIIEEIPEKPDELRAAFSVSLHRAAAKDKTVLIIDSLNQLEDRDSALELVWLPPTIPGNIRLILSTLPGRSLEELARRGWPTLQIRELATPERIRLIGEYLAQYSKALSPARAERIATTRQTGNPLFLKALLEELRVFGIYEKLDARIGHYLEAQSVPELYERILARYEEDYEKERPGLVKDALSLLWASRRGLSEQELLDLLGGGEAPLPRAILSPLFLAVEESLLNRSGLFTFFHEHLRQAVLHRYLPADSDQINSHERLARYFETEELCERKVDELPWQWAQARGWNRLYKVLADVSFVKLAWDSNPFDVLSYWNQVESQSGLRMLDGYGSLWYSRALVLAKTGNLQADVDSLDRGIACCPDDPSFWKAKGRALQYLGKVAEAELSFKRAKELGG